MWPNEKRAVDILASFLLLVFDKLCKSLDIYGCWCMRQILTGVVVPFPWRGHRWYSHFLLIWYQHKHLLDEVKCLLSASGRMFRRKKGARNWIIKDDKDAFYVSIHLFVVWTSLAYNNRFSGYLNKQECAICSLFIYSNCCCQPGLYSIITKSHLETYHLFFFVSPDRGSVSLIFWS